MKLVLYLVGLLVVAFVAWKLVVGTNVKHDEIPDAPKATLDHVRERTQQAMDQTQQHINDAVKQADESAGQ